MWLKRLSTAFLLVPHLLLSQSEVAQSVNNLIEDGAYQQAIDRADSLLELDRMSEDHFYLYNRKGDAYYYLADIKSSLKYYLLASEEPQIKLLENRKPLQEAYSNVGFCYSDLGIHDKALQYYQASMDLAVELNDSSEVGVAYYNMSNAHLKQGNLEKGMELLGLAYEIDKQRKDTAAIGFDLNALGYAALEMNKPEAAIEYFKESILLLQASSGNYNSLGTRYNNLSKAFLQRNDWDSALFYNKKSIEIHEQYNDEINLADRWVNRAMILNQMDLPEQALGWSLRASEKVAQLKNSDLILTANNASIESYEKQGRLLDAIRLTETNIRLAEEIQSIKHLHISQGKYAQLLNNSGRAREAYDALTVFNVLSDSIKTIEAQRAATELSVRYEVDKISSENEILKLEGDVAKAKLIQEQTTTFWLTILVVVVLVTGSFITYSVISKGKIKEQLMQSEISELRLQIKQLIDFKPEESSISIDQLNNVLKEPLSDREFEVLQMAMTDKNNSEIAEKVYISTNTVKYHLKNIYQKLGVSNRKEALKFAFQATSK